jgi:type I restriction enzyme M protein
MGFSPKENATGIYQKKYPNADDYAIEIDHRNGTIDYGNRIAGDNKATRNFVQSENMVVLECVDRLLQKGYKPQNITLEKTWRTGHGTSGRLDILVSRNDGTAYLMIECKTWGVEYQKELRNIERDGGQLFTYFQQDKDADVLMLYTSKLYNQSIEYQNMIIKIEDDYRQTGNVKDFFERWNKLPKSNGIFDGWVEPYGFHSKALTRNDLKVLKQEDSSFIFSRFLEILRYNVVSDKPNAFNKIFNLFLCKIIDEDRGNDEQLDFQWLEGEDDHVSFQKRLTDLYNRGMRELLEKDVIDLGDAEFERQFGLIKEPYKSRLKDIITDLRLKKDNEFAIKEVYDNDSFNDNAKVVKEVVELLQVYQIRYNNRQQFLSDFFELLLTTGLKQESGQFFTPVPIARYIIKSLPIKEVTLQKLERGTRNDLLPVIIDYAAGSGHFITEVIDVVQEFINALSVDRFPTPTTNRALRKWHEDQFDWVREYVYAIEKDYRLVKTAKVSCYLHGDGLAKVIHGDGLADFATAKEYRGLLLSKTDNTYPQDNKQFDIVISNPPYSVSAFKGMMMEEKEALEAFDLYKSLTDQSSEIECLFVERTKQLLKDGGIAGIILPNSILNNTGIYMQTREIILKYFYVLGITELGSGTFMATGTNTVVLFLRRRNNDDATKIESAVKTFFANFEDVTINGIENPARKYIAQVWEGLSFEDYISLLKKNPNELVRQHEVYKEYESIIKAKDDAGKRELILALEREKLFYFILAYPQRLVVVKTGVKTEEKRFLGYEFSFRRGKEGIHPIQRGKTIDECTRLFDATVWDNPEKASTYTYAAFKGEFDLDIPESLQHNVSYQNLVDMLSFDRAVFDKTFSLSTRREIGIESKWKVVRLNEVAEIDWGNTSLTKEIHRKNGEYDVYSATGLDGKADFYEHEGEAIILSAIGARCGKCFWAKGKWTAIKNTIVITNKNNSLLKYLFLYVNDEDYWVKSGTAQPFISLTTAREQRIPLPPLAVQQSIIYEIETLEAQEKKATLAIEELKRDISARADNQYGSYPLLKLGSVSEKPIYGANEKAVFGNPSKDFRYIRITDITDNGNLGSDWRTAERVEERYILEDGDFLVARSGTVGKTFLYKKEYGKALFAGYLIKFPVRADVLNTSYLNFVLKGDIYRSWVRERQIGMAQPNINAQEYSTFEIPVPPLQVQEEIVATVAELETRIQELVEEIKEINRQKAAVLKKWLE